MHQQLEKILAQKQKEVAELEQSLPGNRVDVSQDHRDFKAAICKTGTIGLIAEIKFASPSAGSIREMSDPVAIGRIYEKAGAAAISLLTDRQFFQGDPDHLPRLKREIALPILRKDFIIEAVQLEETLHYGADAVLLIARILPRDKLAEFISICKNSGLAPLVEIHDRRDLEKALACGAEIIGINNRDLDTFKVDINRTPTLAPLLPDHCIVVSESGIEKESDIRSLKTAGIDAVLVGSALMRSEDLANKTAALVMAGRGRSD